MSRWFYFDIKDTPDFFEKSQYSRVLLIMSKIKKIFFVKILPDSSAIFEAKFWGGGIPTFHFQKLSREGSQLGHFLNLMTGKVVLLDYQNEDNFWTKIASTFVEGSIESSENRAFDRDLNEGASFFRPWMRVGILTELWNTWNTPILAMSEMPPEHQKIMDFWKMRFYSRKHQQLTQLTMYYIGRFVNLPKTGVSGRQDLKITLFSHSQHFLN